MYLAGERVLWWWAGDQDDLRGSHRHPEIQEGVGQGHRTDKKENQIFLIFKEIQSGAVAKSYMRKGFLIYEEMRKYFSIYEEAVSHIWLCNCSILNFLIYEENLISFLSVHATLDCRRTFNLFQV